MNGQVLLRRANVGRYNRWCKHRAARETKLNKSRRATHQVASATCARQHRRIPRVSFVPPSHYRPPGIQSQSITRGVVLRIYFGAPTDKSEAREGDTTRRSARRRVPLVYLGKDRSRPISHCDSAAATGTVRQIEKRRERLVSLAPGFTREVVRGVKSASYLFTFFGGKLSEVGNRGR